MKDSIFVFFTILITTSLIYIMYRIMLGSEKTNKEDELQITPAELMQQLNILYKQRKFNIVESLAKNYLKAKGRNDEVRFILAKALYELDEVNEAIDHVKIAIKNSPNDSLMLIFLANCYERIKNYQKAVMVLEEILENDSDNVVAIKSIAKLYEETGQKMFALRMYRKLNEFIESNQEKAQNMSIIAQLHLEFREYDFAIEQYREILEIYPNDTSVRKRLVEIYKTISECDIAIDLATEILNTSSSEEDTLWALMKLMEIYSQIQDYDKALEYANLIKAHPFSDKIKVGEDIANLLFEKNEIDESIELLKSLIQQDPQNLPLRKRLANSYQTKQDFDRAADIYKKILDDAEVREIEQVHAEMSVLYSNWAEYLFTIHDSEGCFKHFTVALQYNNKNPEVYYKLGNVNKAIKNFNEAISHYRKAIELDIKNPDYYDAISDCYQEMDSIYEQKKILIESLKYNPENPKLNYKLGIISNSQNDLHSAVNFMRKAVDLDETFLDAKFKLALMYEHVGKKDEAIELYESILRVEPENQEVLNNLKMLKSI